MSPEQENSLRKAYQLAGPRVRKHLRSLLPASEVALDRVNLFVHPSDNYTEEQLWLNGRPPEAKSLQRLSDIAEDKRTLFLDIGANCGVFTVPLARVVAGGSRFFAFEPNPVMAERLKYNLSINEIDDPVHVERVALGREEGTAELIVHSVNYGQSSLKSVRKRRQAGKLTVPVKPLLPYLEDADSFDVCLLKIDVEGYEDAVLMPWLAAADGKNMPDGILMETAHTNQWGGDLLGAIERAGYVREFEEEGNTLFLYEQGRAI